MHNCESSVCVIKWSGPLIPNSMQTHTCTSWHLDGWYHPLLCQHTPCLQFPDPHYRTARHVVTSSFVRDCASVLDTGGTILLQSDIEGTAIAMRNTFFHVGGREFEPHAAHSKPPWDTCSSRSDGRPLRAVLDAWSHHHEQMGGAHANSVPLVPPELGNLLEADQHGWSDAGWLAHNPWGAPTEREVYHAQITGAPVFRMLLQRQ